MPPPAAPRTPSGSTSRLALTGKGTVDLANPIATSGLRNLNGFTGYDVEDGQQMVRASVDGEEKLRSVSDFEGDLPLDVSVRPTSWTARPSSGDVVGESGRLTVTYLVENVTGRTPGGRGPRRQGRHRDQDRGCRHPDGRIAHHRGPGELHQRLLQAGQHGRRRQGRHQALVHDDAVPAHRFHQRATFGYSADITDGVVPRADIGTPRQPPAEPDLRLGGRELPGRR